MINRTNSVLAVFLVVVVVMIAFVGVDYSKPNIEILPDMKYTLAWEAFAANPNFPDGRTMQPPVPGTIARGNLPLYYAATEKDAVRAGEELENPYSQSAIEAAVAAEREAEEANVEPPAEVKPEADATPAGDASPAAGAAPPDETAVRAAMVRERFSASIERGGEVYRKFCISCHGPKGAGDGAVTQRGFPPPPSMLTGKSPQMKDGRLFHILTYGQKTMAPFAAQLSRERRWDAINYVRDLQSKAPPLPEPAAAETDPAAIPEPPDEPVEPATGAEPEPIPEKPDSDKDVNQEKAANKKPDAPQNPLRDGSSDKSPSASSDLGRARKAVGTGSPRMSRIVANESQKGNRFRFEFTSLGSSASRPVASSVENPLPLQRCNT